MPFINYEYEHILQSILKSQMKLFQFVFRGHLERGSTVRSIRVFPITTDLVGTQKETIISLPQVLNL